MATKTTTFLHKFFQIPPGIDLIHWLIIVQNNTPWQIGGLIGFTLIFWVFFQRWDSAILMVLSMYLHESGHYLIFVKSKIKTIILLLFPLGAVAVPATKEEEDKSDSLPWWDIATLLQAGPTMNILLMVLGASLIKVELFTEVGKQLLFINGMLAYLNLIPVWTLDGGFLTKVMFSSLTKENGKKFAVVMCSLSIIIIATILLPPTLQGGVWLLAGATLVNLVKIAFFAVFILGIAWKYNKTKPIPESTQAMNVRQVVAQSSYFLGLISMMFYLW